MREGEGGVQVMATREREYKRTRQDSAEGRVGEAREGEDGGKGGQVPSSPLSHEAFSKGIFWDKGRCNDTTLRMSADVTFGFGGEDWG